METARAVNEYLAACQANGSAPSTLVLKQSILGRFAQDNPELPLQPQPIFQFLATMGKAQATRKSARQRIRAFYTFVCQKYDLPDPMPQVTVPLRSAKRQRSAAEVLHMGGGAHRRSNTQQITCPNCGAPIYFGSNSPTPFQQRKTLEG